ncbi:MAG: sugar transferase [Candidatus Binatus sp.]|jgi:lipopolysaccharide/colanic/teichoic acid biosynthesis glycosyltransferase|uniref:sugar transferase n=1 Tax=Candidatus Binatus sp. TaxID=2811406 RepID=UPI003C787FFA
MASPQTFNRGREYREEPLQPWALESPPRNALALAIKRLIDICGALAGLVVGMVAYLVYNRRIRRQSGGSVIFRQARVGEGGREFEMYKLRTMKTDAEVALEKLHAHNEMRGPVFKIRDDPRIIPIGKWLRKYHVDELPQFWNVLKGDMSLVGPRPPTPAEVERYAPHHLMRLRSKPGLTGSWQLYGNSVSDFEDIVKLDCRYIDQWSLWLDLKILVKTIPKILRGGGW